MLFGKFTSVAVLCFLLLVALSSGKHTLHVDDVLSSATNTVLLREVESEMYTVDSLDLKFIDLNLQGESNFIMDTQGPLSFDGSFVGFNSPNYVNIVGEQEGRLDTTGSASLSGDSLEIDAQRFIVSSGGDIFMNTDGSIIADTHRFGISSLTHAEVAVATGPLELFAGADLEMTATHVELIGDDRISLYSSNSLDMTSTSDFQSYSAFIDFDSYGDIRLSSQSGNIHVDSIRDIIFEAEDIQLSAPIGIELQSEHGEIYVDAGDTFSGSSSDVILMETSDEARFIAENEFNINSVDLSLTTSELIKFHAKTLEIVFSDAIFQSHTTEVKTGGDVNFLLNSSQGTSYFMGATNGIEFESRNIVGSASSDLSFYSENSGDISLLASSVFDSKLSLDTNTLSISSVEISEVTAPVIRLNADDTFVVNANDIDIRTDSSIGDRFTASAGRDINIFAHSKISNSIAENGKWNSIDDTIITSAGDIFLQSGENLDEIFFFEENVNDISFFSDNLINIGADGTFFASPNTMLIRTLEEDNSYLMAAYGNIEIDCLGNLLFNADDQVLFELEELYFEAFENFRIAGNDLVHFFGAEIDFWASGSGEFDASDSGFIFSAEETIQFQAFSDLSIEELLFIESDLIVFEGTENVDISIEGSQNYITDGILEFEAAGLNGISYEGNNVNVSADTKVTFDGGFITMRAFDDILMNASEFTIESEYEEDIRFIAKDDFFWTLNSGSEFVKSADDIIFSTESDILISSSGNSNILIRQGYNNYVEDNMNISVDGNSILNSINGDIHFNSASDIDFSAFSSSFDFTRYFKVDVEGDSDSLFNSDISFTSTNEFSIFQEPGPASIDDISFSGNQEIITLTGSFSQENGSTTFKIGDSFTQTVTDGSILLDSTISSYITLSSSLSMNAKGESGNIWLEATNDYHGSSVQSTTLNADIINFNSEWAENIQSKSSNNGDISITSGSSQGITWNAVETFNITALGGLDANAAGMVDGIGIWFAAKDKIMSEIDINSRSGNIEFISLDSQILSGEFVSLVAGSDFTFTNFYPPLEVGGVRFTTQGSYHDGIYEDESGISIRSYFENAMINIDVPKGESNIHAGSYIKHIVSDADAIFNAKESIKFEGTSGDILIDVYQGDILMQSNIASVTFESLSSNGELQASDSIETLAGKAISLISTDKITSDDNNLSFDFSALEGNIITSAVVKQPIIFEGNDFDLYSNEEMYFIAADNIPFTSITGGINVNSDSGIYLKVDGGDLDITASNEIFLSSSENHDTRIESGNDMYYSGMLNSIEFSSGIDNDIRTTNGDVLFQTSDSLGDIFINSEGEIRFQADGTDDNIGASQVDGIFVDAPQIQAFARDDILFDAYTLFTIGANTRPVISLEAGGSSTGPGVSFIAEGNINQVIGENFLISSNGALSMNSNDLDIVASGAISIVSSGSILDGKDVIFQSDQKSTLNADNISFSANEVFAMYSEKILNVDSSLSIDIDIAGSLETNIRNKYDINADDWTWSADLFTLDTRGDVIISNGNSGGGVSVYGDSALSFNSDVIIEFFTFSDDSPLSISTIGGTSIISISSESIFSDILFEISGNYTATSIADSSFSTEGAIQINSPLDSLYSNSNSAIDIVSAGDLFFNAELDVILEAAHGLNITAGSDMDLSVDGFMNIYSWGDAYFVSKQESLSIRADYNITFESEFEQNGDISLSSTRDIEYTVGDAALFVFDGNFITSASESYEFISDNDFLIKSYSENSNIMFTSQNGPIIIDIIDSITMAGGDIYLSSTQDESSMDIGGDFTLSTIGIHNKINFNAFSGIISFTTTDVNDASLFEIASTSSTSSTPNERNGNGFIDFTNYGVHPSDGYSIRLESLLGDIDFDIDHGFLNLWSSEQLTFDVTGSGFINSQSSRSDTSLIISASSPGGSVYFDSEIGDIDFNVDNDLNIYGDSVVEFLPFDNLFISANQPSASNEQSDILLKATHPSGDLNIFTTDFLTADIVFQFGGDVETFSEKDTVFLLLDDDDTAEIGTYLVDAGGSISMGAENDFDIIETGPGDIQITDTNGQLFFSAGNDITVFARQILELSVGTLNVDSQREFILSGDFVEFDVQSLTIRGEGVLSIDGENHDLFGSTSLVISTSDSDVDLSSSDVNQEVFINAIVDMEFNVGSANIEVPPHRIIDFRDGLLIPRTTDSFFTGSACSFSDRSLFYSEGASTICYCNTGTASCLSTIQLNVEVP